MIAPPRPAPAETLDQLAIAAEQFIVRGRREYHGQKEAPMSADTIPHLAPGAIVTITVPCPQCGADLPYRVKACHRWYGWMMAVQRDKAPCRCKHGTSGHADLRCHAQAEARRLWGLPPTTG
jgi:hypothetical protein